VTCFCGNHCLLYQEPALQLGHAASGVRWSRLPDCPVNYTRGGPTSSDFRQWKGPPPPLLGCHLLVVCKALSLWKALLAGPPLSNKIGVGAKQEAANKQHDSRVTVLKTRKLQLKESFCACRFIQMSSQVEKI
jgi:hypothetical protein